MHGTHQIKEADPVFHENAREEQVIEETGKEEFKKCRSRKESFRSNGSSDPDHPGIKKHQMTNPGL